MVGYEEDQPCDLDDALVLKDAISDLPLVWVSLFSMDGILFMGRVLEELNLL